MYTIDYLRLKNLIILEAISGSKAYGLDTPESDTDIKGIFIMPEEDYFTYDYVPQISNETNDIVFYELGRFMELLSQNNPNILELLNSPSDSIIYKDVELIEMISSDFILSKLCLNTFGKFALSQIRKAKGLNKKIHNPVDEKRKSLLSFCTISYNNGSIPLEKFLEINNIKQENCGLTKIPNMKDIFGLHHDKTGIFNGIIRDEITSNEVCLSSIPKEHIQLGLLYFNRDGYSIYCKEYKEYWEWVKKRNNERYKNTISHGKNYDSKNMMHVFRLLDMAIEIAKTNKVNVRRNNREFLLKVKSGHYEYDDLIEMSNLKQKEMEEAFGKSTLPENPDIRRIRKVCYLIRKKFYLNKEENKWISDLMKKMD